MIIVTPYCLPREEGEELAMACAVPVLRSGGLIHSYPCPKGIRARVIVASALGKYLIVKWRSVILVIPSYFQIEQKKGATMTPSLREGVTMAPTLLFLADGFLLVKWRVVIIVTPSYFQIEQTKEATMAPFRKEGVTMASTPLFLEDGFLLVEWRGVIIVTPSYIKREEGRRWPLQVGGE